VAVSAIEQMGGVAALPLETPSQRPLTPWPLVAAAVPTALGLAALWLLARAGWPGTQVDCRDVLCYCEATASGLWRQPINTWSNLAPLLAGFVVAAEATRRAQTPAMRVLGIAFPLTLVAQGLGAMVFHASLLSWAGVVDAVSMFVIIGLLFAINVYRGGHVSLTGMLWTWLGIIGAGALLGVIRPEAVSPVMGPLEVAFLGTEVRLHARGRSPSALWFRLGITSFLIGVAVWYGSATEGTPLCNPASVWQGHALWHTTSGLAIYLFWRHVRANLERPIRTA
jgi:hypothetical protein